MTTESELLKQKSDEYDKHIHEFVCIVCGIDPKLTKAQLTGELLSRYEFVTSIYSMGIMKGQLIVLDTNNPLDIFSGKLAVLNKLIKELESLQKK